jgi:hypothetical protein
MLKLKCRIRTKNGAILGMRIPSKVGAKHGTLIPRTVLPEFLISLRKTCPPHTLKKFYQFFMAMFPLAK